jgi:hypothetical protein
MVDCDGLPAPPGVDPTDPLTAGGALRRALPPSFRSARAVVQLSGTAGLKPDTIKAHLWFWLDRPASDELAKRWLKAASVDTSTCQPVGVHYTAAPLFDGVDDPCHERLAILPGYDAAAVPDLREPPRPRWRPRAPTGCEVVQEEQGLGRSSSPLARGLAGIGRSQAILRIRADVAALANAPPGRRHPAMVEAMARARFLCRRHRLPWPEIAETIGQAFAASLAPDEHPRRREAESMAAWLEDRDP